MSRLRGLLFSLFTLLAVPSSNAQTISNLDVIAYSDSARVSFETDVPTTAVVDYGTTTPFASQASDPALQTTHTILLPGLTEQTTYLYEVTVTDEAFSSSSSDTLQFDTPASPVVTPVTLNAWSDSARVSFATNVPTVATVEYGLTASYGASVSPVDTLTLHDILLASLLADTTYYYRIVALDTLGQADTLVSQFATPPFPVVSDVATVGLATSGQIVFNSNVPATAVIHYGTSTSYSHQIALVDTALSHEATISSLSSNTQYFFEIVLTDTLSQSVSFDSSFTTTSFPVISNIAIPDTTTNSVTVTFDTDVRAFAYIEVRDSTDNPGQWKLFTATDSVLATSHTIVVDTLEDKASKPSDLKRYIPINDGRYQYRIIAIDSLGNKKTGSSNEFVTKPIGGPLPMEWTGMNIGPVRIDGRSSYDSTSGTFILIGQGDDLYKAEDSFYYLFQPVVGDFVIQAHIRWHAGTLNNLSKAATHFRVDTTKGSQMVTHSYNYRFDDFYYYREVADELHDGIVQDDLQQYPGQPMWVRLTRSGNDFISEYSLDGLNWSFHGPEAGQNVRIPREGMVGLATVSKSSRLLELYYDSVSVVYPSDVTPPVLSNLSSTPINNTAQISYKSNEWVSTVVDYGLTASYGDSLVVDSAHVDTLVTLSDLLFSTEYHYRVRAFDADSNMFASGDMTFITEDQNPLAVELKEFVGRTNGTRVHLSWSVGSADRIARFDIQEKRDADFETVGSLEAAGATGYGYDVDDLAYGMHSFRIRIVESDGSVSYTQELEVSVDLATAFELTPAWPNPFTSTARFNLSVRDAQRVRVELYNTAGQLVRVVFDGDLGGNSTSEIVVQGDGLSDGLYFYRVRGSEFSATGRVLMVR